MFTFLDLLLVVGMVLIASSLLCLVLMFAIRNKTVKRVFFYITVGLGLYIGYVGARINWLDFAGQMVIAVLLALVGVGALVLSLVRKNDDKAFLIARLMSGAALIAGVANALLI